MASNRKAVLVVVGTELEPGRQVETKYRDTMTDGVIHSFICSTGQVPGAELGARDPQRQHLEWL